MDIFFLHLHNKVTEKGNFCPRSLTSGHLLPLLAQQSGRKRPPLVNKWASFSSTCTTKWKKKHLPPLVNKWVFLPLLAQQSGRKTPPLVNKRAFFPLFAQQSCRKGHFLPPLVNKWASFASTCTTKLQKRASSAPAR